MNDAAVYRTAPATPGLLNMLKSPNPLKWSWGKKFRTVLTLEVPEPIEFARINVCHIVNLTSSSDLCQLYKLGIIIAQMWPY